MPDPWKRAAPAGALWGAAEVVMGSALHNSQVPMAGFFLTGIGIALLVAVHRQGASPGLFWRSAIICAGLKSLSPSANTLGPMVAIAVEGALLELGFWLMGGRSAGYFLGGALAMAEPLAQKGITLWLTLGPGSVEVYQGMVRFAAKASGLPIASPAPIAFLLVCTSLLGIGCAALGVKVAGAAPYLGLPSTTTAANPLTGPSFSRSPSLIWLTAALAALPLCAWISAQYPDNFGLILLAVPFALRYRSQRLFSQSTSVFFGITFMLAMFLHRDFHASPTVAALAAAGMVARAAVMISCFDAVAQELRHPRIVGLAARRLPEGFLQASREAARSLPKAISLVPPLVAWGSPTRALATMIQGVQELPVTPRVLIVTGESGAGKTKALIDFVEECRQLGIVVCGRLQPSLEDRNGYDIVDIASGLRSQFMRLAGPDTSPVDTVGRFERFEIPEGFTADAPLKGAEILVLDEIGPLELQGRGHSQALRSALVSQVGTILIAVRPKLVREVQREFGFDAEVVDAGDGGLAAKLRDILSRASCLACHDESA